MAKHKLGVGIIGCGGISRRHAESCMQLDQECVIKAVADIDLSKALARAATIGSEVTVYEDYREMLMRDDIDVITVCTPPFLHKEPVIAALQAGKHVIVEKPMAGSLQDCDEMIAMAEAHNCKLGVMFQLRFDEKFRQVRALLQSEEMGPVVFGQMNGYYWRGSNYYNIPWRGRYETECGGVTMNHSIHTLDAFLWLMDSKPVSVFADMDTIRHNIEVEDISIAVIRFESGAIGQVNCTLNMVKSEDAMAFSSESSYVSYPLDIQAIQQNQHGFPEHNEERFTSLTQIAANAATGGEGKHVEVYADFFDAIRENRQPFVNGVEGRRTLEIITAMYKSATTGTKVTLPLAKDDPWYTRQGILENVKRNTQSSIEAGEIHV